MRLEGSPQKVAATELRHGRAQFAHIALENLFEVAPDAILVTDNARVIREASPYAAELFGPDVEIPDEMPFKSSMPERYRRTYLLRRERYATAHPDCEIAKSMTGWLDGRIAGSWVWELDHAWQKVLRRRSTRRIVFGLRNLTYVSAEGAALLQRISLQMQAKILAGLLWPYFFREQEDGPKVIPGARD